MAKTVNNRVVVVTGANKGIGYAIIEGIIRLPDRPTIVLTSRNEELGQQAVNKLLKQSPDYKDSLYYHQLDINDNTSVEQFRNWLKEKFGKLDVLVNNAGILTPGEVMNKEYQPTEEEFSTVVGTNYFKTRALTEKLLPLLSDDGKIINVSSTLGAWQFQGESAQKILNNSDLQDSDIQKLVDTFRRAVIENRLKEAGLSTSPYGVSKALLNAWTVSVLLKQLTGNQQAFVICPGPVDTDMGKTGAKDPDSLGLPFRPIAEAVETPVYLVGIPYVRDDRLNGKPLRYKEILDYNTFSKQEAV